MQPNRAANISERSKIWFFVFDNFFKIPLCFTATALLLTIIQPPINCHYPAWIALVPFAAACSANSKKTVVIFAYLIGLLYWLVNVYWLSYVTIPGWFVFCCYLAIYWAVQAWLIKKLWSSGIPFFIALPVVIVGCEALQSRLLDGFAWRLLAHSQYQNIALIQIADIFGVEGVSFLVAMVNGLICDFLRIFSPSACPRGQVRPLVYQAGFTAATIIVVLFYGCFRINQTDCITAGPLVSAVQSNEQVVAESGKFDSNGVFLQMFQDSCDSARHGSRLIVWPETMVQENLDESFLAIVPRNHRSLLFNSAISRNAKYGCYILVGTPSADAYVEAGYVEQKNRRNSAFLYKPDGNKDDKIYHKIHLVPFGEYMWFQNSLPWISKILMAFTPYDYDYCLVPGREYTIFDMESGSRQYKFGVMICYEDTMSKPARKLAVSQDGKKQSHWLVNISNDGWFVKKDPHSGKLKAGTELPQHLAGSVFRAVENRVSVLRSVNCGASCIIDSLGRVKNGFHQGTLPRPVKSRTTVSGWFSDTITIDGRITFFSKAGPLLDFFCSVLLILAIITNSYRPRVGLCAKLYKVKFGKSANDK